MRAKVSRIGKKNAPVIVQNGASGIEEISLVRSGPGVGVWRVDTSCKRNDSFATGGPDRDTAQVWLYPQESEGEYIDQSVHPSDDYITKVHIHLPIEDRTDHWVVDTRYDKHGVWIIAFLMPTAGELFTPEQIRSLRGEE